MKKSPYDFLDLDLDSVSSALPKKSPYDLLNVNVNKLSAYEFLDSFDEPTDTQPGKDRISAFDFLDSFDEQPRTISAEAAKFPLLPANETDRNPGDIYRDQQGRILEWTEEQGLQTARYERLYPTQKPVKEPDTDQGRLSTAGSSFMLGLGQIPAAVAKAQGLSSAPPAEHDQYQLRVH